MHSSSHRSAQTLFPTSSFDLSGLIEPLGDGLNLSISLVLDTTFGHLGPLSSFCFSFLHYLLCFSVLRPLLVVISLSFVFCPWLKIHSSSSFFSSSSIVFESPFAVALGIPYSASSSGSQGVATCPPVKRQLASLVRFFDMSWNGSSTITVVKADLKSL